MQMARSKFPGKPSKPVKKRRVTVLGTENCETEAFSTEGLQGCQGKPHNLQNSHACEHPKHGATKRRTFRVQLDRPFLTKRRRIENSTRVKLTSARQSSDNRSENQFSNRSNKKPNVEATNLGGKFVLPSRSAHSSRVIKPNKRFLNIEDVTNAHLQTVVKRSGYTRRNTKSEASKKVENKELQNADTGMSRLQNSSRRIVLRQARLQLDTQRSRGLVGPFSSNFRYTNESQSGTIACGVCGTTRFYRFINQARKFNIYSCDPCRKFIMKMIKRQRCNNSPNLQCFKGEGLCPILPVPNTQKSVCNYKARCSACWLKMCLRTFHIPQDLKSGLVESLPEFMRDPKTIFNNSSLFSFHTNLNLSATPNLQTNLRTQSIIPQRVLRRKVDKDLEKITSPPNEIKRQKIDLKGPRVKHVCRSASIVLGQAVASFPENSEKPPDCTEISKSDIYNSDASENKENDSSRDENCPKSYNKSRSISLEPNQEAVGILPLKPSLPKAETSSVLVPKRERDKCKQVQNVPPRRSFPVKKFSKNPLETIIRICCDFWENYDSDEVGQSGFGLVSPATFPLLAVCFLCGSAGQDPLLYCCSCCEAYHPFCLEQAPFTNNPNYQYYNWLCPKCIRCTACGEISRQRVNCQKCHKPYHPECFNIEWQPGTQQTVCSACKQCKSCGTNIIKFIGNTALCRNCFKLKNMGHFCPICNQCYNQRDYDMKMMECGKCKMWVHAKCEGLTDEQFLIFSTLPASVEFFCVMCEPLPYWRKAVDVELQTCFNKIIKLVSNNNIAKSLLKWKSSPVKSPLVKSAAVRKISFVDPENETYSDLSNDGLQPDLNEIEFVPVPTDAEDNYIPEGDEDDTLKTPTTPILSSIKNKINCQDFRTLQEFNIDMEEIILGTKSTELSNIYHSILKEIVPWFDPSAATCESVDVSFCDTSPAANLSPQETPDFSYKMINNIGKDTRRCVLCKGIGDGSCYKEARMLYCGNNEWIHANCAMWSSEVYEEIDGSLQNVHAAISRGRLMSCTVCKRKGASIGCCSRTCHAIYHFPCAYNNQCYFMQDKSFYCHIHYRPGEMPILTSPSEFLLSRCIYVELDHRKKRYNEPIKIQFMVGSLTITCLGNILPQLSDNAESLIPLNFSCRRLFWSTIEPWKLVPYVITTTLANEDIPSKIVERNFTVDHSLSKFEVSEVLKEIDMWQNDMSLEVDDDEEPQNENAPDLLSPELTDAILEELPHGVLDRISMQDIFPKLMGSEELIGGDKLTDINNAEIGLEVNKKSPLLSDNIIDCKKNSKINRNKLSNLQNRQRCSVAVCCKADNSLSKNKNVHLSLVQLDGACETSSDSDSTIQDVEDLYTPQLSDEPVKCQRCQCTYRTLASYSRHLETCDSLSMSDSDLEPMLETDHIETVVCSSPISGLSSDDPETISLMHTNQEEPYVVSSYESYTSFQTAQSEVHSSTVNTQTFISSESTAEVLPVSQHEIYYMETEPDDMYNQNTAFPVTLNQSLNCDPSQVTIGSAQTLSFNQQSTNQLLNHNNSVFLNQRNCSQPGTISIVQPTSLPINRAPTISLNAATPIHINQPMEIQQSQQLTIQSVPMQQEVTPIINITPQNQITLGTNHVVSVSQNQLVQPVHSIMTQKSIRSRGRPRSLAVKRTVPQTVFVPQGNTGTPVVIHQLPSSSMIPTFIESFQQQTGQNLQFVTSITPQMTPVVNQPHVVQFQPENAVVNLLQGMQPTVILPQAQVLGDQIIVEVDNGNSLMWSPQSLQSIQPVLYGFETIVQNTVLQSQQFLPTTVPGILTSNSSFSTTTQVFQTSKLEPVLDVTTGNFVLVNSNPVVNSQHISMPQQVQPTRRVVPQLKPAVRNSYVQATAEMHLPKEAVKTVAHASTITNSEISKYYNTNSTRAASTSSSNTSNSITSSINLPVAPFLPETRIPTNVVTPTPKPVSTVIQSRPMNRVLPMPTKTSKTNKTIIKTTSEMPPFPKKVKIDEESIDTIMDDLIKPQFNPTNVDAQIASVQVIPKFQMQNKCEANKAITVNYFKDIKAAYEQRDTVKPAKRTILITTKLPKLSPNLKQINLEKKVDMNVKSAISKENKSEPKKIITVPSEEWLTFKEKCPNLNNKITDSVENIGVKSLPTNLKEKPASSNEKCSKVVNVENLTNGSDTFREKTTPAIQAISSTKSSDLMKTLPDLNEKWSRLKTKNINLNEGGNASSFERRPNVFPRIVKCGERSLVVLNKPSNPNFRALSYGEKPGTSKDKISIKETSRNEKPADSLLFSIEANDGFQYSATSLSDLWGKVIETVQAARAEHGMPPLPSDYLNTKNGLQLLGEKSHSLKYLKEQLPGAAKCSKYKPSYHFKQQEEHSEEEGTKLDITNGLRSTQYTRSHEPSDMFGWLASRHRKPIWDYFADKDENSRRDRTALANLPAAVKFRNLKLTSRNSVGVYRSKIHKRGLFCHRDIESAEMVIEYAGEVIRSIVADKREKQYLARGMGCYMFRIDENFVVDATMKGNAARFINHSCEPNCYSKVIEVSGHKHIMIYALRKIVQGEELTYDYKFPFEEDKIPCTCGARRCRKFLN